MLVSCGYIGDPLPPAMNIPGRIGDLSALQRGEKIVLEFTIPPLTTEGLQLKVFSIDLRAGASGASPFNEQDWLARSQTLGNTCAETGPCQVETPLQNWVGQEVYFRVRVLNKKGRDGGWSNFSVLKVIPPVQTPFGLQAEAVPQGVQLTWQGPQEPSGLSFRIRRRQAEQKTAVIVTTVSAREWVDTATQYGKAYEYSVQAVVKAGEKEAESEISEPVSITPEDHFPPAVPSGLTAVAGPQSIELAWERNTEPDLRGYRIYRSVDGGPFERIADLVETPAYSDRKVEVGEQYRYQVSAMDQLGNESEPSAPVEAAVP